MTKVTAMPFLDEVEPEPTTRPGFASAERVKVGVSAGAHSSPTDDEVTSVSRLPITDVSAPTVPSTTRLGPYQIVCELASGGMATVYLALYRSVEGFEKLCAVKRIHPHLASDRDFTNMFADEAQIAARISHPFVCSVFSFGRSQQSHYIAMEFLRGEPLSAVIRRAARSPELGDDVRFPALASRLVANLAEGLHAAHTLRDDNGALLEVVHRDVTPQNLFVLYDGTVRVTDFGIAQARRRLHHTEGQKLKGKLSYLAPEQLHRGVADLRVDVWGLGVTLWELLTGRRLFLGSNEGETLASVMSRVVQPPSTFRASVPQELDRIVLRALERDVSKRYQSARSLARDLERFLTSVGDQVPAMDVADWMAEAFPEGAERVQRLVELAGRVSVATREDTVVRVPSSPPSARPPLDSFVIVTAEDLSEAPATLPPTRRLAGSRGAVTERIAAARAADEAEALPEQVRDPARQRLPSVGDGYSRSLKAEPGRGLRIAVVLSASLLTAGIASLVVRHRLDVQEQKPRAVAAARSAVSAAAAPAPSALPPPIDVGALAVADPVVAPSSLPPVSRKTTRAPRPETPALAPAPSPSPAVEAPAVAAVGDLFISIGGTGADVLENGRALGRAPGRFRLSVGDHVLTLRFESGAQQALPVTIKPSAPTLITLGAP